MTIRKLEHQDITDVAEIHQKYLSDGLLANLGYNFLKEFYELLSREKSSFTFVATEKNKIIGFVTMASDLNKIKKKAIRKLWYVVLLRVLKNPNLITKVLGLPFYPGFEKDTQIPEILSLAVTPENRGKGIGKALLFKSKGEFKKRGFKSFLLSVRSNMKEANAFYQKIGLTKVKIANFLGEEVLFYKGKC